MRDDVRDEVVRRLKDRYGFKESGDWLRKGRCPDCLKTELFAHKQKPWTVKCGRESKCGWSSTTKELFPDAFERINERFPATTETPNATADAYLHFVRGLEITGIRNWYRQGQFRHFRGNRVTATVVFDIAEGVWNERLVEPVTIAGADGEEPKVQKSNNVGAHKGLWWAPPGLEIADGEELWLVEGCIDAMTLHLHGIKAVATLSSVNYPETALAELAKQGIRPKLIWALDNDHAGRKWIGRHVPRARKAGFFCAAALVPQKPERKTDWNDAHLANELGEAFFARCRHQGDLLLAPTPLEYGLLVWRKHRSFAFSMEFGTRTWWWELNQANWAATVELMAKEETPRPREDMEWEAARRCAGVQEIANVAIRFLYFQKDRLTDESWYYTRVSFPNGKKEEKNTFTGAQIASASEFKKRLLAIAPGAFYTGSTHQLNWMAKHNLDTIRVVDTVDFVGYSKQHRAYIFPSVAVANGKIHPLNDEDYFSIDRLSVKTLNHSLPLHVGEQSAYRKDWIELVYRAFGPKGIIAAAFFLGSFFAEQIREMHKSYPFLEVVGDAGSGKSTLIEALWKLCGRNDYEGFDPNKSTLAARARIMSQVANLPVSLIESDRGDEQAKQRQFDWDELKTAYNGRASRATGVANGGNDTKEPPFRGSILISQNAPVNASEAIMQRIVHTRFTTAGHNADTKAAADELASLPVESLAWFLLLAIADEARVLKTVAERSPVHEAALLKDPEIRLVRLAKNHSQLMALVEALAALVPMKKEWTAETLSVLAGAARTRQQAIATDPQVVEEFWELVDFLGLDRLSHCSPVTGEIALNLNHVVSVATRQGLSLPPMADLKKHLKNSRSRPYVITKAHRSVLKDYEGVVTRCWFFKAPKDDEE